MQHLVWPPLQYAKAQHGSLLEVHIVYLQKALMLTGPKLDASKLQALLRPLVLDVGSVLTVKEHYLPFTSCDICTAAFTRSAAPASNF